MHFQQLKILSATRQGLLTIFVIINIARDCGGGGILARIQCFAASCRSSLLTFMVFAKQASGWEGIAGAAVDRTFIARLAYTSCMTLSRWQTVPPGFPLLRRTATPQPRPALAGAGVSTFRSVLKRTFALAPLGERVDRNPRSHQRGRAG